MTFEEAQQVRAACLEHAHELMAEARRLLDIHAHLAYQFTTLALEEIGKITQVFISVLPVHPPDGHPTLLKTDDHVQKLLWALWSPLIAKDSIDPAHLQWCHDFAAEIHKFRLEGLYVDFIDGRVSRPRDAITPERAKKLHALAEARLKLAEMEKVAALDEERKSLAEWFGQSAWDEEKAKLIFSKKSLAKYVELENAGEWFKWLKEQFDKADEEARELGKRELERQEPSDPERGEPKWKVKVRLETASHSIRQTELNWISQTGGLLKLDRGKSSAELFVTITLPKAISVHALWDVAWMQSRRFVAALNIGSFGFFWWHLPADVSRFYVQMVDLEANAEVRLERMPRLALDWGGRVLNKDALFHAIMVYSQLPRTPEFLEHYLNGLAFMAKNDIHQRLEPHALIAFYEAFRVAFRNYGDWDGSLAFLEAAKEMFARDFPTYSGWQEILGLADVLLTTQKPPKEVTLTHLAGMKMYCDAYIIKKIKLLEAKKRDKPEEESA
jgi:AbiV family abortive infection protein